MARAMKRNNRSTAPLAMWKPPADVNTSERDPPDVRAEKDRLVAEFLSSKGKRHGP